MRFQPIAVAALAFWLSGCVPRPNVEFIGRVPLGYPRIQFLEAMYLRLPGGGLAQAPVTTVLIGDRRSPDGDRLYCGMLLSDDPLLPVPIFACVRYLRGMIVTEFAEERRT